VTDLALGARLLGRVGEPPVGVLDDIFAVGVRHVEFREA
jgi:hypothetical protein